MKRDLRSDAGVVEFSAMLPLILLTVIMVWEAFLIGMSATFAGHAANEGARVAAVGGGYDEVRTEAVRRVSGIWADEHNISVHYPSHPCPGHTPPDAKPYDPDCGYVRVRITPPLLFPGVLSPLTVTARTRVIYEGGS